MLAAGLNDHKGESRRPSPRVAGGMPTVASSTGGSQTVRTARCVYGLDHVSARVSPRAPHPVAKDRCVAQTISPTLGRRIRGICTAREKSGYPISARWGTGSTPRGDRGKEIFTVQQLLRLTELQALDRVRECAECQRWFMARRRNQNFCQVVCRRRKQRGQQNKEAFALYQKWYRREQKIKMWESRLRRARPSVRQQIRAEIVELRNNGKAFLEQRWRLLQADK